MRKMRGKDMRKMFKKHERNFEDQRREITLMTFRKIHLHGTLAGRTTIVPELQKTFNTSNTSS